MAIIHTRRILYLLSIVHIKLKKVVYTKLENMHFQLKICFFLILEFSKYFIRRFWQNDYTYKRKMILTLSYDKVWLNGGKPLLFHFSSCLKSKTESVPQNHRGTSKVYGTSNLQITIYICSKTHPNECNDCL